MAGDPVDAWQGTIPFEGLPRLENPARGWIASANNPTAPPDFPYPLSGTWAPEDRASRAEHLLSSRQPHSLDGFGEIQTDVYSGRAERGTPGLLDAIAGATGPGAAEAVGSLSQWDFELTTDSIAASIYYVFLWRWHRRVITERFDADLMPLVIDSGWGLSADLLHANTAEWFVNDEARRNAIRDAFGEALSWLRETLGPDPAGWQWGKLHRLGAPHPAARTPLQHELLDIPAKPHAGGASTLAAAFYTPPGTFGTRLGANYRLLAELGPEADTRSICWPGQSGHAGSLHYADQVDAHLEGRYESVSLDKAAVQAEATSIIRLTPG
jgi:penicillin amidase